MDILSVENTPFAVALAVLFLLLILQLIGLGHLGGHLDLDVDGDVDVDGADMAGAVASMLGMNRLPMMVWLSLFLASFALLGLTGQHLIEATWGAPLSPLAAAAMGLLLAIPATAILVRPMSYIWPHDETTAVSIDGLLGRRGSISIGTSRRGSPARAQVKDNFGQPHHVMVEPHEEDGIFVEGDEVLLVRRDGEVFYAVTSDNPYRLNS